MSEIGDAELTPIEAALKGLAPMGALDRDLLMFRAGQQSVPTPRLAWPTATAAALVLALSLGMALALRPAPETAVRLVYVKTEAPEPTSVAALPTLAPVVPLEPPSEFLKYRLQGELGEMPRQMPYAPGPRVPLEELLGIPVKDLGGPGSFRVKSLLPGERS